MAMVAEGTSDRLRAILLTTIATVCGLLLLGYGLIFATPLTLVLIPCLYVMSSDIISSFGKKGKKEKEIVAGT